MHPRRPVFGLRRVVFYAFFCYFAIERLRRLAAPRHKSKLFCSRFAQSLHTQTVTTMQNHERMKQQNHYTQALAYLRDYCLRHGRLMHFSAGDIFETEGAAARLFGYIESGSFHYLVRRSASCKVTLGSSNVPLAGSFPRRTTSKELSSLFSLLPFLFSLLNITATVAALGLK